MQEDIHITVTQALVALGGNLPSDAGSPGETLRAAVKALERSLQGAEAVLGVSRFYRTPCFPAGAGPDYINAVMALSVSGGPRDLLETLHRIEAGFGRVRMQRWGQRTLDLDLLAFGNTVFPDVSVYSFWRDLPRDQQILRAPDDLVLPHPRLQDRAFVLVPLRDVAPGWRHPVSGMSAAQMLDRLDPAEISEIRPVGAT